MTATTKEQIINSQPEDRDTPYPDFPTIDFEAMLPIMEDEDIPEEQKRELIEIMFNTMMMFANHAWGIDPTQNVCGQNAKIEPERGFKANNMIEFEDINLTNNFNKKAE